MPFGLCSCSCSSPASCSLVGPGPFHPGSKPVITLGSGYAQPGLSIRSESLLAYYYKIMLPSEVLCQFPAVALGGWNAVCLNVNTFTRNAVLGRVQHLTHLHNTQSLPNHAIDVSSPANHPALVRQSSSITFCLITCILPLDKSYPLPLLPNN